MASHNKRPSEGIALLSIYGDEDDEMEEIDEEEQEEMVGPEVEDQQKELGEDQSAKALQEYVSTDGNTTTFAQQEQNTQVLVENFTPGIPVSLGTPKDSVLSLSPQQKLAVVERRKKEKITIVDYGHDEVAMSPEQEEGEITASGMLMESEDLAVINRDFQDKMVHVQTPGDQTTYPQSVESNGQGDSHANFHVVNKSPSTKAEDAAMEIVEEPKEIELLNKFLPPPPKANCSEELQEKIIKFLVLKKNSGRSFNAEVRNRKDYRNPDFLRHAVTYQDIDEIGSCFSKDVFDPHGYDKSDFYDELEADMRREMERKEQERKRSPKIDFFSAGTQIGAVPTPKISLPIPGLPIMPGSGLNTITTAVDTVPRDGRQNKKSKWDKVDVDRKTLLSTGGQDSVSTIATQAALLSAANAGSGYSAYAEQRRREAEDKRSSDRKPDRRS